MMDLNKELKLAAITARSFSIYFWDRTASQLNEEEAKLNLGEWKQALETIEAHSNYKHFTAERYIKVCDRLVVDWAWVEEYRLNENREKKEWKLIS